ncbi:unnamed protein product [Eruca vesicaria subsp. sativa]|uniref:Uncharacterized protein n=1 Tax=Eruca vesicaria subsp. sativa TaxID=29727 RepID=A0ABC8IXY5_ERUVS|nr:unnamed protein product [Eruca vesicaria subsp. sativa]CAH8306109.1 unnamed protein product [Eruca vesicaria subsp. sativa]
MKISFSSVLFVLMVVFIISSSGNKKMVGEAKDCFDTWTCEGGRRCREKCAALHKGTGWCTLPSPYVPAQCNCYYTC